MRHRSDWWRRVGATDPHQFWKELSKIGEECTGSSALYLVKDSSGALTATETEAVKATLQYLVRVATSDPREWAGTSFDDDWALRKLALTGWRGVVKDAQLWAREARDAPQETHLCMRGLLKSEARAGVTSRKEA